MSSLQRRHLPPEPHGIVGYGQLCSTPALGARNDRWNVRIRRLLRTEGKAANPNIYLSCLRAHP